MMPVLPARPEWFAAHNKPTFLIRLPHRDIVCSGCSEQVLANDERDSALNQSPRETFSAELIFHNNQTRNLGPHLVSGRRDVEPTIRCLGTYLQAASDTVLLRKSNC